MKDVLLECLNDYTASYVIVAIDAEGVLEFIVVPNFSFEDKAKFYAGAYKEDGTHVMNSKVKIVGCTVASAENLDINIFALEEELA